MGKLNKNQTKEKKHPFEPKFHLGKGSDTVTQRVSSNANFKYKVIQI